MKGSSKVIMGATLVMAVTLAIVIGLVMVLLVELNCSLLLRRQKELRTATSTDASGGNANRSSQQPQTRSETPSLSTFGVLHAPRSLLFPAVSGKETTDIENQNPQPPELDSQIQKSISTSTSHQFKILYASPPSPALTSLASSLSGHKAPIQCGGEASSSSSGNVVRSDYKENMIYISNPIYDNEVSQQTKAGTPFGTPDSSPSRPGTGGLSGDDDDDSIYSIPMTPSLSPMKKLLAEACPVSLRDANARSLATCGSDSNSNHGLSSTSSGSPSTSSW